MRRLQTLAPVEPELHLPVAQTAAKKQKAFCREIKNGKHACDSARRNSQEVRFRHARVHLIQLLESTHDGRRHRWWLTRTPTTQYSLDKTWWRFILSHRRMILVQTSGTKGDMHSSKECQVFNFHLMKAASLVGFLPLQLFISLFTLTWELPHLNQTDLLKITHHSLVSSHLSSVQLSSTEQSSFLSLWLRHVKERLPVDRRIVWERTALRGAPFRTIHQMLVFIPLSGNPIKQLCSPVCPPSSISASSYQLWLWVSGGVKAQLSSLPRWTVRPCSTP